MIVILVLSRVCSCMSRLVWISVLMKLKVTISIMFVVRMSVRLKLWWGMMWLISSVVISGRVSVSSWISMDISSEWFYSVG